MAEAAWQVHRELGSDLVRRLVARPIRVDSRGGSANVADLIAAAEPVPAPPEAARVEAEPEPSDDLARLRSEILVMKAVLDAERREGAQLRARIEGATGPAPVSDEARAVRDRWATLVDRLLHAPH